MKAMTKHLKDGFKLNDRYQIEEMLGIQDIGQLYRCSDRATGRGRARLRILFGESLGVADTAAMSGALSLLRRLQHPNLGRVLDYGIIKGSQDLFVVQEWVDGKDIWVGTEDVEFEELLSILIDVVQSVHYLHTRGLVHGCLNSSNIILAKNGKGTRPKLLDFGLVRSLPQHGGSRLGNPVHLAPELLLGGAVTQSSDLYSLGILIYQLLTRRLPFEDVDPGFLVEKRLQVNIDLRPIGRLKNGAVLKEMLCNLLERDADKRSGSSEGVLRGLIEVLGRDTSRRNARDLRNLFSSSRFVGRDNEQSLLKKCASQVEVNGRGWTVFVSGEGGLGKSRLLEEFSSWARLEGWRVIEGACDTRHQEPYGPYRQILAQTESMSGESIFRFENTSRSQEMRSFEPSPEFAAGQFRDLLTRELVRRLSVCPTLLLLHDFHLSDEATSTVLDYLSSDIQTHPILMCVSLRSCEDAGGGINRAIEQALRQQRGEVLNLEPLVEGSVGELVAGITGDARLKGTLGSWMYNNIGGNPFFIEEMLKHLVEQGLLRCELDRFRFRNRDLQRLEVPETIGAVLQRRLVHLSSAAGNLANWLALFHRPITKSLLTSILEWEDAEVAKALQELRERQLVRIEMGDAFEVIELGHVLFAEVIRGNLPKAKRLRMHRKIAEVLEREYGCEGNLQELAMHAMEGRTGVKSVRYALTLATQSHAEFAHEKALQCYEYVFRHRGDLTEADLCQAAIEASDTMFALGIPTQAIRLLKREMNWCGNIDQELRAGLLMQFAVAYKHLGDLIRKDTFCKKGLHYLRHSRFDKNPTKALLWAELAFNAMLRSNPKLGLRLLKKAQSACPESNSGILAGRIQNLAASLHRVACNFQKALIAGEKAVSIFTKCDSSFLVCSAYSTLGLVLMGLGRFSLALRMHQDAVTESEKNRSVALRAQASANLLECLCKMGRMTEAAELAENASEYIYGLQNPSIRDAFIVIMAEIKLNLCDYSGALDLIRQLDEKRIGRSAVYISGHAHYVAASAFFYLGDFDSAIHHIETIFSVQRAEAPFYERELAAALQARIMSERGLADRAIKQLRSLDKTVTRKKWPYQMCIIKLHLAEIMLRKQLYDTAKKLAKNALRLAKGMHSESLIGQSYLLLGSAYSRLFHSNDKDRLYLGYAIENLQFVCNSSASVSNETVWRACAELSLIYEELANSRKSVDYAEKAHNCLSKIERRLSQRMQDSYINAFGRNYLKSEVLRLADRRGSCQTQDNSGPGLIASIEGRILLRVSAAVNSIPDINRLLERILDQLIQAAGLERAFAFLADSSNRDLCLAKGRNHLRETIQNAGATIDTIVEEVFERGLPMVSSNAQIDPRFKDKVNMLGHQGVLLCAPLRVADRILGVLYADHSLPEENLSESVFNLFAAFCNLAGIAIDNTIVHQQLAREKSELEEYFHLARGEYPEIVGKSAVVESLRDRIGMAAQSPLDILVIGESGTGKELVAKAIHSSGNRKNGKFIAVDCGSLSDTLAEAELFGYRKGAFTGAFENRPGLLEAANGGILFLDEISNMPLKTQPKLLRVLQEREVRRIGETITRKVDFQVVSATNRDILLDVREGKFREDLYHRLRGMEIRVPPLRDRLGDIQLLVDWHLSDINRATSKKRKFSQEAREILSRYHYPGNIRELKNVVADAYYSAKGGQISVGDLPVEVRGMLSEEFSADNGIASRLYIQIAEGRGTFEELVKKPFIDRQLSPPILRSIIERALRESAGSYRKAFSILKIPGRQYSLTIRFLKHYKCYLNYQQFRQREYD